MSLSKLDSRVARAMVAVCLAAGCSVRTLPPPQTPERVVPQIELESDPPPEGFGQVTLDTVGGPAHVEVVTAEISGFTYGRVGAYGMTGSSFGMMTAPVCTTPCVANLPLGPHELVFESRVDPERVSRAEVQFTRRPSVFRYDVGLRQANVGSRLLGILTLSFGLSALMTGPLLVGLSDIGSSPSHPDAGSGMATAGWAVTGVGGALTLVGALVMALMRPVQQDGSGVQWNPTAALGGSAPP